MIEDDEIWDLSSVIEYYGREPEPLGEMATVCTTDTPKQLRIQINPDPGRIGNPYFKAYTTSVFTDNTKVARLHFFDSKMEYHKDRFKDWKINKDDCKRIINLLNEQNDDFPQYTNWQMTCWLWNMEYGFIHPSKRDDYMAGKYDDKFVNDKRYPSYVPSTTVMPETWIYDPPKSKSKRS